MTSTPERGFEIPFCQLLIAEGHRIVHIDSHSQTEDGKDVISVDPAGRLCGFQLKHGDINAHRWRREVHDELRELVDYPVHHPNFLGQKCKGYLVTTGRLNEVALHKMAMFNASLPRNCSRVELIDGQALLTRFLSCQQSVLPTEPADFHLFLQLLAKDGQSNLDAMTFTRFLDGLLPSTRARKWRSGEIRRRVSGSLLLSSNAATAWNRCGNHFAMMEAWTFTATRLARARIELRAAVADCRPTENLAIQAAYCALSDLTAEAIENKWLVEGTIVGDGGSIWRARATMLAGCIAADQLVAMLAGRRQRPEPSSLDFVNRMLPHLLLWGESAVPYFLAITWLLRTTGQHAQQGENILLGVLRNIGVANTFSQQSVGLPCPYYSIDECLDIMVMRNVEYLKRESFYMMSYTALPIIYILARAMRRNALSLIWADVCDLGHYWTDGLSESEFLKYRSSEGVLRWRFLIQPTSWRQLLSEAEQAIERAETSLPRLLRENPSFAVLFLLTHPHRCTPELVLLIEESIGAL